MFDLDYIEQDWLKTSKALSEEEIIDIFYEDNATIPQYKESYQEWLDHTKVVMPEVTAEEILMREVFGYDYHDEEKERERMRMRRLREIKLAKYPEPQKGHLSKENQNRVIEGTMNFVFEFVRYYHHFFDGKVSEETLYDLLLDVLIKIPKYMVHCGKPVYRFYVRRSFINRIIDYISYIEKVSTSDASSIYDCYENREVAEDALFSKSSIRRIKETIKDHNMQRESIVSYINPNELYYLMRNQSEEDKSISDLSREYFFKTYEEVLNELDEDEKIVMQLSYDSNGYPGLTYEEIAEFMGISKKDVRNIKRRSLRYLRNNDTLKTFI